MEYKPELISDHEDINIGRITERFKQTDVEKFTVILSKQVQELEQTFYDLLTKRGLDTAEGEQLDKIGEILNTPRAGFNDENYVIRLKAAIIRYNSKGRPEDIISAFSLLTQAEQVIYGEVYPAKIRLTAVNSINPVGTKDEIRNAMEGAKAAGVGVDIIISTNDTPFVFFGDTYAGGEGFGTVSDANIGGNFAELI